MTTALLVLSAALLAWKADIETASQTPVLIAEVAHNPLDNTYSLAAGTPDREVFATYLRQPEFLNQFAQMYAVLIHHKSLGSNRFLIMLNGRRRAEWQPGQEALIAHELGHAWIKAHGYPAPILVTNQWACVGIHAGDITQHVLIRAEMDKRRIDHKTLWFRTMLEAAEHMEANPAATPSDRCSRVRQTAHLVDLRLGLTPGEWPGQLRYEAAALKSMPEVAPVTDTIVNYMRAHDMSDRKQHREALQFVFERLKELAYQPANH